MLTRAAVLASAHVLERHRDDAVGRPRLLLRFQINRYKTPNNRISPKIALFFGGCYVLIEARSGETDEGVKIGPDSQAGFVKAAVHRCRALAGIQIRR